MHGGDDFRIIPPLAHSVPDLKSESVVPSVRVRPRSPSFSICWGVGGVGWEHEQARAVVNSVLGDEFRVGSPSYACLNGLPSAVVVRVIRVALVATLQRLGCFNASGLEAEEKLGLEQHLCENLDVVRPHEHVCLCRSI